VLTLPRACSGLQQQQAAAGVAANAAIASRRNVVRTAAAVGFGRIVASEIEAAESFIEE
jgi:hypothetical protein